MNSYTGEMIVNGRVISTHIGISVLMPYDTLYLSSGGNVSSFGLSLNLFSSNMFTNYSHEELIAGVKIELSANNLGQWRNGPTGFIGDNEFDVWPINQIRIVIRKVSNDFIIYFTGMTETGYCTYIGSPDPSRKDPLHPWKYSVKIVIPAEKIKELLNVNPLYVDPFNTKISKFFAESDSK